MRNREMLILALRGVAERFQGDARDVVDATIRYVREDPEACETGVLDAVRRLTGWPEARVRAALEALEGVPEKPRAG